jgi:nucleotide-binding universal stress UspA family protein
MKSHPLAMPPAPLITQSRRLKTLASTVSPPGQDQQAPDAIIKLAKQKKCDLIVVGSQGCGSLERVLWQQSLKVLTFSQVPVLVCH